MSMTKLEGIWNLIKNRVQEDGKYPTKPDDLPAGTITAAELEGIPLELHHSTGGRFRLSVNQHGR